MRLDEYLKDKILVIVLNVFCMYLLYVYLMILGNESGEAALILIAWGTLLLLYFGQDYIRRRRYFDQLQQTLDTLDQRYLIGEVMGRGIRLEDRLYRQVIRESNKAVIERIRDLEDEQKEYKEYIESWIHEVKIPITTLELICHNNRNESTRRMENELVRVDNYVEMALYYARSDSVYKDYMIQKMSLTEAVTEVIAKNKQYLIQSGMSIDVAIDDDEVFSDPKWVSFILNQIVLNSVKYKREGHGTIRISTQNKASGICLMIEDDGIGIKTQEIPRIFDKGFTGSNGRSVMKSTGMGLYLCKKLCNKLGLSLEAESKEKEYTRMVLSFPISRYLSTL